MSLNGDYGNICQSKHQNNNNARTMRKINVARNEGNFWESFVLVVRSIRSLYILIDPETGSFLPNGLLCRKSSFW